MSPSSPGEWDDALVEWKNDPEQEVSRHDFTYAVAAVKFFFPAFRRSLPWSQAVQDGWERSVVVRHTVPLPKMMSKFLAVHMASRGRARMGAALVVQTHCGLRPSELLGLKPEHLSFPMADGGSLRERPVFLALGLRAGTKVGRQQVSRLLPKDFDVSAVLHEAARLTLPGERIFDFSMSAYRSEIIFLDNLLRIQAGWGPHSPRAGFATDSVAEGMTWDEIRSIGRWEAEASLKRCVDQVAADRVRVVARGSGWAEALSWCSRWWYTHFLA